MSVERGPTDMIEDAVLRGDHDPGVGLVGEVVGSGLDPLASLPQSVGPLGIGPVPAPGREGDVPEALDLHDQRRSVGGLGRDPRRFRDARSRAIVDLVAGVAERLDPSVGPDAQRVVERSEPVAILLCDEDQREVIEAQRNIDPVEATIDLRFGDPTARGLRFAHRPDAP